MEVEVVLANNDRATLRVGDVFLKIDGDQARTDVEVPPRPGPSAAQLRTRLATECEWLVAKDVLPVDVVERSRRLAETALRPWTPVFVHGDLHIEHVFVDADEVAGIIDWSEASQGDALSDLATLTLAHPERLDDLLAGYGSHVDRGVIRAWRSLRCLLAIRWLFENGYGSTESFPEVAVLRSMA